MYFCIFVFILQEHICIPILQHKLGTTFIIIRIICTIFLPDLLDKPPNILFQLLKRVASEARDKCRLVGIELGINPDQLAVILEEKDAILCYSEVFSQWEKKANPMQFPFQLENHT